MTRPAAYDEVWGAFEASNALAHHRRDWAAWARDQTALLLFAIRLENPAVLARLGRLQRHLAEVAGLELHPPHFLHVTLQFGGFLAPSGQPPGADQVSREELEAAVERAAPRLARVPAFELPLGGVNAFQSAVFVETPAPEALQALRTCIRTAGGAALRRVDPWDELLFHLTLGYFGDGADAQAARAAIRPLRGEAVGSARVEAVDLVRLPTAQLEPYPAFEVLARFPLDRGRERPPPAAARQAGPPLQSAG